MLSFFLTIVFTLANSISPALLSLTYSPGYDIVYAAPKGGFKSGSFGKSSSGFSKSFNSGGFKSGSFSTSKSSKSNSNGTTSKSSIFGKQPSPSSNSYNTKRSFIPLPFPVFTSHRSFFGGGLMGLGIISAFVKLILFIFIIIFIIRLIRKIRR